MRNKNVEITKLTGDLRLMTSPECLRLFMVLLQSADQNGQLLFNASQYAKSMQVDRSALDRILKDMVEMGFIAKEARKGKTWITICDYDYYIATETAASNVVAKNPQSVDEKCEAAEEKDKNEKKSFPCTLSKEEKEKKEKQMLLKNNNKNKDDKSCGNTNLCSSSDDKIAMKRKRVLSLCEKSIDERKQKFGEEFLAFMAKPCGKSENRWIELKNYIDKNEIPAYFTSTSLTLEFMSHWCQEVIMSDNDGEDVGTVLLFETEKGWNWWKRITSFVKRGYEIKLDVDARKAQREDQLAVSKARRHTAESNSQKAFAQTVKANLEASINNDETDVNNARLEVGFSHFIKLFDVKANLHLAQQEWKKLSKSEKIAAIKGAQPYCMYCNDENIKMVNPDTYLRNHRWKDEIPDEYYVYYDDEEEETEEEGIRFIEHVYAEIEEELDKKSKQQPQKLKA